MRGPVRHEPATPAGHAAGAPPEPPCTGGRSTDRHHASGRRGPCQHADTAPRNLGREPRSQGCVSAARVAVHTPGATTTRREEFLDVASPRVAAAASPFAGDVARAKAINNGSLHFHAVETLFRHAE